MNTQKLQERRKELESFLQEKLNQLTQLDQTRSQLTVEIIEIRGKLNLIKELESDLISETEEKKGRTNNS